MTEYIDKTEAMRRFKPFGREIPKEQVMAVLARIDEGIVRCGECEHGIVETGSRFPFEGNITCELDHVKRQWFKNDFCSYGERSEE